MLFISLHRYGDGFYPGSGAADETGTGAAAAAPRSFATKNETADAWYPLCAGLR